MADAVPQFSNTSHPHAVGANGTGGDAGTHDGHENSVAWIGGMGSDDQTEGNDAARQSAAETATDGAASPGAGNLVAPCPM